MRAAEESVLALTRRGHLRELGIPTIFGAAVLFVSATLLLGVNISALRGNLIWAQHAQLILQHTSALDAGILGEELTVRGYALSGDKRFLDFQNSERNKIRAAVRALDRLAATDPEEMQILRTFRRDVDRHLATFGGLKGIGPDKASLVARAIVDPDIRASTKRVRSGLAKLTTVEQNELAKREGEMASQISQAFVLGIGIILAAVLLGGFGLMASQLHISLRR